MNSMKEAIRLRRMKNADPMSYMDEMTVENADQEEKDEDIANEASGAQGSEGDIAPPLKGSAESDMDEVGMYNDNLSADDMVSMDDSAEEDSEDVDNPEEESMENDPMLMARLKAMLEEGGGENRPGLRGKAMANIKGMLNKMKG